MNYNINTQATTFWNFVKENTIEIPIIQRDYAQGRLGKENLRKTFLADLKKALDKEAPYKDAVMKLDFVYGSAENGKLNPLDGQQRLTTLWLLHWYIALRAGELNEDNCKIFRKFTYETRISSREFCQNLCVPEYFQNFDGKNIVGFITKQTWFYSAWKQDPTIQSMLRMLGGTKISDKKGEDIVDGIEEIFQVTSKDSFKVYWERLTTKEVVVFYHLPLIDFGLSDDLYIKMNARGKQLTSFENFKADLIGYITNQAEDESLEGSVRAEWKKLIDPESGIPIKIDTDWTDIFWKNKSKGLTDTESKTRKSNQIDEIYFAFLNRFFWNELFIAKNSDNKYILDIGKGDESSTQENNNLSYKYLNNSAHDNDTTIAYEGLEFYRYDNGEISLSFFQKLKRVMDNYSIYSKEKDLPECLWNTSFRFIPKYAVENDNNIEIINNANDKILCMSTLNQVQRIVFFAICKFFDHYNNIKDNELSLKRWMRVVWNLVSGEDHNGSPEIRSTSAMRTAIEFINSLDTHNVYYSLAERSISGTTSFEERCKEEIEKAKQILNGKLRPTEEAREEIITEAEKYAFFKGAIGFLFTDVEGNNKDWDHFDKKWEKAKSYFDSKGVKDEYQVLLTRSLVVQCDNWEEQLYDKQIFNPNANTWKWILTAKNWKGPIHHILMGDEINPSNENNDAKVKQYVTSLFDKFPFKDMMEKVPDGRFKWYGGRLAFYYNKSDVITFDWDNFHRNEILVKLKDDKSFSVLNNQTSIFFWGWNINFNYKYKGSGYSFQWVGRPNEKELDVYLMENDWADYKKRLNPTSDKGTDEDNYFCFRVKDDASIESFIESLKALIDLANKEQQGSLTTNTLEIVQL